MKIIAIASQKGGSGKSTVSIHLATLAQQKNLKTLVADMDEHSQTAGEWANDREAKTPLVARVPLNKLSTMLTQAENKGFDLVVLDLPPYVNEFVEEVTKRADLTLVPTRPSYADMKTLPRVLKKIHPPFAVLFNACKSGLNGMEGSKTREARNLLETNKIPVCPHSLGERVAFSDALNGGKSVNEFDPSSKASVEVEKLLEWVLEKTQTKLDKAV